MKQNKMREELAQEFLHSLEEEKIPWKQEWGNGRQRNAVSGMEYRGTNALWLSYQAEKRGYKDSRWCTYRQAQEKGWQVRKGEKGVHVEFWSMYDTKEKKKLSAVESRELKKQLGLEEFYKRVSPISNVYTVFNAGQIDGIPELSQEKKGFDKDMLVGKRDVLLANMNLTFHEKGNKAFYQPSEDSITMPALDDFKDAYSYMSTFLHESAHATGHESRMQRDLGGGFGSVQYAREELRAEIASAFTSQTLGLEGTAEMEHLDNHKAYIQSWIEVIKKDSGELFAAIRDAEKISDYLVEKGEFEQELKEEKEVEHQADTGVEGEILKNGFTPTDTLKQNMMRLSEKLGHACTLSEVKEMVRGKSLSGEMKTVAECIAAECRVQELTRPKPEPKMPDPVPMA